MATALQIQQLYVAYFGRPADPAGLDYWVSTGISTKDFAAAMYAQPEFQQANANLPVIDQVNALYLNLFGRSGDTEGLLYWTQQINTGKLTLASIANDLIYAANNNPSAQSQLDKTALNNKTATAIAYTGDVRETSASLIAYNATSTTPWVTGPQFTSAVNYLATVTQTAPTAAAIQASVDAMTAIGTAGQTFTLTTNADTATANVFNGNVKLEVGFALNTLNNGDQLTGSGVNPTLNVTILENGATIAPSLLSGIETVNVGYSQIVNTGATTLTLTGGSAFKSINASSSAQNATFNGLTAALTTASISNTAANHTFTFTNAALAGTSNALALTLSGVTGGNINFNPTTAGSSAYETLNVVSSGVLTNAPAQLNNGTGAGYSTLNITGSAAITLAAGATPTTATTINASGLTGVLDYTAPGAANITITGGSANDFIRMAGTYNTADTINGGAGTNTLSTVAAELVAATAAQSNVSNIQVIGATDAPAANSTITVSNFGATGYRYFADATNNFTLNFAAGTSSLNFQNFDDNAAAGVTLTANAAGVATTDVLNVTMGSTAAGTTFGNGAKTFTGFETVNILSQGAANTFGGNLVLTQTAATEAIVLTGAQAFTITGTVTADSLNASGMTGGATLTLTGGATAAINVTGTSNNDAIRGSGAADILSGGDGNDLISNQVAATTRASAGDVLTGGSGQDAFNLFGSNASAAFAGLTSTTSYVSDFTWSTTAGATDIFGLSDTLTNYAAFGTVITSITGAVAAAGATVLQSLAQNAVAATATANVLKLTTGVATTGLTVQQIFDSAIGAGSVTGLAAINTGNFVTVYDTTNSQALVMLVSTGADTTLAATDVAQLVGIIKVSAADYAAFDNTAVAMNA